MFEIVFGEKEIPVLKTVFSVLINNNETMVMSVKKYGVMFYNVDESKTNYVKFSLKPSKLTVEQEMTVEVNGRLFANMFKSFKISQVVITDNPKMNAIVFSATKKITEDQDFLVTHNVPYGEEVEHEELNFDEPIMLFVLDPMVLLVAKEINYRFTEQLMFSWLFDHDSKKLSMFTITGVSSKNVMSVVNPSKNMVRQYDISERAKGTKVSRGNDTMIAYKAVVPSNKITHLTFMSNMYDEVTLEEHESFYAFKGELPGIQTEYLIAKPVE